MSGRSVAVIGSWWIVLVWRAGVVVRAKYIHRLRSRVGDDLTDPTRQLFNVRPYPKLTKLLIAQPGNVSAINENRESGHPLASPSTKKAGAIPPRLSSN